MKPYLFIILALANFLFINCDKDTVVAPTSVLFTDTTSVAKPISAQSSFWLSRHSTQCYPGLNEMTFGPYPSCFNTLGEFHVFFKPKVVGKSYEITIKCSPSTSDTTKLGYEFSKYMGDPNIPYTITVQNGNTYLKIKTKPLSELVNHDYVLGIKHHDKNAVFRLYEAYIKEIE